MIKSENHKIKTALISVSDKTGIIGFAKELVALGIEIYSTGGTYNLLKENGIDIKTVSELTSFPEILDGRVKTLHPAIHAGILAKLDDEDHIEQLNKLGIKSIDLLVVNLYPFEDTLMKGKSHNELIENIDIGGPTMLRASAKNYEWTLPIVNPDRYSEIIHKLKENNCTIDLKTREELAFEVFNHTAYYDSIISRYLAKYNNIDEINLKTVPLKLYQKLRYGENPHQKASLIGDFGNIFRQIHGKELSYNNIIDIDSASKLILEFEEPTLAIIKHTNPCGVGTGNTLSEAYQKAFATDNVSPFGGIIAVNRIVDKETAETIHSLFTELIIAPQFSDEALEILQKKRDRRLIVADYNKLRKSFGYEIKSVSGGYLVQSANNILFDKEKLTIVTKRAPTEQEMKSLIFGWKVVKHVKSNAIVYASEDRTLAIGAGQMSRVDSSRIAVEKAKLMGIDLKGSIIASDAYFPFADGVLQAVEAGATAVIQPGGSIRDPEVINAADENNLAMVFTSIRHFKH